MTSILKKISITPGFLLFVLLFSYLDSIKIRIVSGQRIDGYLFTPEAVISILPSMLLIVFLIGSIFLRSDPSGTVKPSLHKTVSLFLYSMAIFILAANGFAISISLLFDTVSRNFSLNQIISSNLGYLLDFCIYGGFYLAFFLFQREKASREQIEQYNVAMAASQIQQLRQQLDPHFLFNNLNILDQLIHEDSEKASAFLVDFSDLYRYLLENGNKQLVPVRDELEFSLKYFELIRHKYGNAYQLSSNVPLEIDGEIPALSLQILVENAVQHNFGTEKEPVIISITMENGLVVRNTLKPKVYKKKTGGRSLQNLKTQYKMLTGEKLKENQTSEFFEISFPIINSSRS